MLNVSGIDQGSQDIKEEPGNGSSSPSCFPNSKVTRGAPFFNLEQREAISSHGLSVLGKYRPSGYRTSPTAFFSIVRSLWQHSTHYRRLQGWCVCGVFLCHHASYIRCHQAGPLVFCGAQRSMLRSQPPRTLFKFKIAMRLRSVPSCLLRPVTRTVLNGLGAEEFNGTFCSIEAKTF